MNAKKIAVIGAGHGGYGMAADLTLAGYEVHLYGSKERGNLEPVIKRGGIELSGISRTGFAKINLVTTEIAEAIRGVNVIMVVTQSLGHETIAERCAPYLEDGQTVVLLPGNFGSVLFARILREKGGAQGYQARRNNRFPPPN